MSQFSDLATYLTGKMNAIITKLNQKVDKVTGKGLSTEDFTTAEKNKLAGIQAGAGTNTNDFDAMEWQDTGGTVIHSQAASAVGDDIKVRLKGLLAGAWNSSDGVFELTGQAPSAATTSALGLVQIGTNLYVNGSGVLSVDTSTVALKTYVDTAIDNLVNGAQGSLDTLQELAAALGNDPNLATTITNMINQLETDIGTSAQFETYMNANLATIV